MDEALATPVRTLKDSHLLHLREALGASDLVTELLGFLDWEGMAVTSMAAAEAEAPLVLPTHIEMRALV